MRYFVTLSYDGTNYHGWQIQPQKNAVSVQQTLQDAFCMLLQKQISVVGAGRTDAGVHARMMVAHFDLNDDTSLDVCQLAYKLNKVLPNDIAVQKIEQVSDDMHARFSALSRTYHYFLHFGKDPFLRHYSWKMYGSLNFERMNEAAQHLLRYRDFSSFSKSNTDTKTNECVVTEAVWEEISPDVWRFTITANRFLRNMVRAIVGTLVEVGRGRLTVQGFCDVIEKKDRQMAGDSVPASGLFLMNVTY